MFFGILDQTNVSFYLRVANNNAANQGCRVGVLLTGVGSEFVKMVLTPTPTILL